MGAHVPQIISASAGSGGSETTPCPKAVVQSVIELLQDARDGKADMYAAVSASEKRCRILSNNMQIELMEKIKPGALEANCKGKGHVSFAPPDPPVKSIDAVPDPGLGSEPKPAKDSEAPKPVEETGVVPTPGRRRGSKRPRGGVQASADDPSGGSEPTQKVKLSAQNKVTIPSAKDLLGTQGEKWVKMAATIFESLVPNRFKTALQTVHKNPTEANLKSFLELHVPEFDTPVLSEDIDAIIAKGKEEALKDLVTKFNQALSLDLGKTTANLFETIFEIAAKKKASGGQASTSTQITQMMDSI